MVKYIIGSVVGGLVGYFVLYKLIGCSNGSCAITSNPYISTVYGIVLGLLFAGVVSNSRASEPKETNTTSSSSAVAVEYKKLSPKEAKERIDSKDEIVILDVRKKEEYLTGYIPDAVLVPNESIADKRPAALPDLDAEILVYCRSGRRSALAAKKLIALGYTNVYDFGGIIDWPYETEKSSK